MSATPQPPYYLGIDVGGTNTKAGVVDDNGQSLSLSKVPTEVPEGLERGLQNMQQVVANALKQANLTLDDIRAIGLVTPGPMDIHAGRLLKPHNLPTWGRVEILKVVRERFGGKPTILQNDANAAAYGEYWVGAARDADILVFWTLGTGIGTGIVINGNILEGAHSHGGESGHIIIAMDGGRYCDTGQYGTLEAYCGAKSVIRRTQEALNSGRDSVLNNLISEGQKLTPLLIAETAENGDELANEIIMETARCMGVGTTTLMHTVDPNMVLIGGAMTFGRHETDIGRRFLQRIRAEVDHRAFAIPASKTTITYAELGGDAGYIGAAGCARLKYGGMS